MRKDGSFEWKEMVSATVTGITKLGRVPMEVVTAGSPALGATNILAPHFEEVLQASFNRAEPAWKTAVENWIISHALRGVWWL